MQRAKKCVSVFMPQELYRRVKERAEKTCRTVPGYIRQVLVCELRQAECEEREN